MADPRLFGEPNRAMVKLRWWRTWVKEPRHMIAENLCTMSTLYLVSLGSGESHWNYALLSRSRGQGSPAGSDYCRGHVLFWPQWANVRGMSNSIRIEAESLSEASRTGGIPSH